MSGNRVVIRGLDDVISLDAVILYLESGRCPGGGGDVEEGDAETRLSDDGTAASITFTQTRDLAALLQEQHVLCEKKLTLERWSKDWEFEDARSTFKADSPSSAAADHDLPASPAEASSRNIKKEDTPTSSRVTPKTGSFKSRRSVPEKTDKSSPKLEAERRATTSAAPASFFDLLSMTHPSSAGHVVSALTDPAAGDPASSSHVCDEIRLPAEIVGFVFRIAAKDSTLLVQLERVPGAILLSGGQDDVTQAKLKLYEIGAGIEKDDIKNISQNLMKLVTEPPCFDEIMNAFRNRDLQATLDTNGGVLYVIAKEQTSIGDAVALFRKLVSSQSLEISREQEKLTEERGWTDAVKSLTLSPRLLISQTGLKVVIEGMTEQVDTAMVTLKELLLEMDRVAVVVMDVAMKQDEWKLMSERVKIEDVLDWSQYISVVFKYRCEADRHYLQLSGAGDTVHALKREIESTTLPAIQRDTITIVKAGLTIKLIESSEFKRQLHTIEITRKCIINVSASNPARKLTEAEKLTKVGTDIVASSIPPEREISSTEPDDEEEDLFSEMDFFSQAAVFDEPEFSPPGITVVQGDLTKHKSDIVVCSVVYHKTDLRNSGAVGKVFAAVGGPNVIEGYSTVCANNPAGVLPLGDVYPCNTTGHLPCTWLIYVPLREWRKRPLSEVVTAVKQIIRKCLDVAHKLSVSSIAFPTIGCGKIGFPPETVANCFKEVVPEWLKDNSSDLRVEIVAFEENLVRKFEEILKERSSCGRPRYRPREAPSKPKPKSKPVPTPTTSILKTLATEDDLASDCSIGVEFRITALSRQIIQETKADLQDLTSDFLHTVTTKDESLKQLSVSERDALTSLGNNRVEIHVDEALGEVRMSGVRRAVEKARGELAQLLMQVEQRLRDPNEIRRLRGEDAYLRALGEDEPRLPSHWSLKKTASSSLLKEALGHEQKFTDLEKYLHAALEKLVMDTWNPARVGHGADAKHLKHTSIKVKRIQLNENPHLYQDYAVRLRQNCYNIGSKVRKVTAIKGLGGEDEVKTATCAEKMVDALRLAPVNEYFLFHGTTETAAGGIAKQGLDFRLSNKGLFGKGVYLAESSTKADQYSDRSGRHDGSHYMYICRVLLSNPYLCKGARDFRRPPCTGDGCNKDTCTLHPLIHDSVIGVEKNGGTRLLFREFVVFDHNLCYPEFLVEYERI